MKERREYKNENKRERREERDLEECVSLLKIEGYISNLKIYVDSSTRLWRVNVNLYVVKVKRGCGE